MKNISLLTVDAAGTLLKPWPSVGAVYGRIARRRGISVQDHDLNLQFVEAFREVQKNSIKHKGNEKEFWQKVVDLTFQPFHKGKSINDLFEELWNLFASGEPWKLADNALDTLSKLLERGYRLAILSNNDSRLRSVLHDLNADHLFEHLFISSEIGFEKPQKEIFQTVEKIFQVKPHEIMHLGDSITRDYFGARDAGWHPILFNSKEKASDHIMGFTELLSILP